MNEIEKAIETDIDAAIEKKHSSYKGMKCMVCEGGEIDENNTCDACGAEIAFKED